MTFIVVSCAIHGLALTLPIPDSVTDDAARAAGERRLVVHIAPPETTTSPDKAPTGSPETHETIGAKPPATAVATPTSRERLERPAVKPSGIREKRADGQPSAAELMQRFIEAIPDTPHPEAEQSTETSARIFDPEFRNKLEAARREQARRKALADTLAERPYAEVTANYGDYIGLRIGDKCWRYPVRDDNDPFDTRIAMRDTRCRKESPKLFSK